MKGLFSKLSVIPVCDYPPRSADLVLTYNGITRSLVRKKEMRPVKVANRNRVRHHMAEIFARKPHMRMKGRRLDLKGQWHAAIKIKRYGVVRSGANGCRCASELGQRGATMSRFVRKCQSFL
jgi:hypothetical protein